MQVYVCMYVCANAIGNDMLLVVLMMNKMVNKPPINTGN